MAAKIWPPARVLLVLAVAAVLAPPISGRRGLQAYVPLARRGAGAAAAAAAECRTRITRGECLRSSRWCRWCRSEAVDDMCFGSNEAWRLPSQVFSCESNSSLRKDL